MIATCERHARAVEHAREHVAAERVDAEDVVRARAGRRPERVERLRVLVVRAGGADELDDQRREDRREHQEHDEDPRRERHLVLLQPAPEQLQRRAGRDRGGRPSRFGGRARARGLRRPCSRRKRRCLWGMSNFRWFAEERTSPLLLPARGRTRTGPPPRAAPLRDPLRSSGYLRIANASAST